MVDVVVWDIGMVLVEWHPEAFYAARLGAERQKALFAEVDLHGMNVAIDRGTHSKDAVYSLAEAHPDWADEIRLWHDEWIAMLAPDVPGSAYLLRILKARGVKCVSMTNFGDNTMDIAKATYPVLTEFDEEYVSGRLRTIKPEAEFYEAVERGTGLSGDRLLFTDDKPENLAVAAARGWRTHLFDGPDGWGRRLVAEGLLEASDLP